VRWLRDWLKREREREKKERKNSKNKEKTAKTKRMIVTFIHMAVCMMNTPQRASALPKLIVGGSARKVTTASPVSYKRRARRRVKGTCSTACTGADNDTIATPGPCDLARSKLSSRKYQSGKRKTLNFCSSSEHDRSKTYISQTNTAKKTSSTKNTTETMTATAVVQQQQLLQSSDSAKSSSHSRQRRNLLDAFRKIRELDSDESSSCSSSSSSEDDIHIDDRQRVVTSAQESDAACPLCDHSLTGLNEQQRMYHANVCLSMSLSATASATGTVTTFGEPTPTVLQDLDSIATASNDVHCPVCAVPMIGWLSDVQIRHVNSCLDGVGPGPGVSESDSKNNSHQPAVMVDLCTQQSIEEPQDSDVLSNCPLCNETIAPTASLQNHMSRCSAVHHRELTEQLSDESEDGNCSVHDTIRPSFLVRCNTCNRDLTSLVDTTRISHVRTCAAKVGASPQTGGALAFANKTLPATMYRYISVVKHDPQQQNSVVIDGRMIEAKRNAEERKRLWERSIENWKDILSPQSRRGGKRKKSLFGKSSSVKQGTKRVRKRTHVASSSSSGRQATLTGEVLPAAAPSSRRTHYGGFSSRSNRKCPFYKQVQDTNFIVDGFGYSYDSTRHVTAWFLSHFHSDHYIGLHSSFSQGAIFCSEITARFVIKNLGVKARHVVGLPMNERVIIDGVGVTLIDANHCPGAVMFLFEVPLPNHAAASDNQDSASSSAEMEPKKRVILHTGDFRYNPSMNSFLVNIVPDKKFDVVYLDTTYCDPKHCFMPQSESILYIVKKVREELCNASVVQSRQTSMLEFVHTGTEICDEVDGSSAVRFRQYDVLFLVGAYTIGKERIPMTLAREFGLQIGVPASRMRHIRMCFDAATCETWFTTSLANSCLHIVPMSVMNLGTLQSYAQDNAKRFGRTYSRVVAIRPTGWTGLECKIVQRPGVTLYSVPYSEHSSFPELVRFVQFAKPHKIIPTVNNSSGEATRSLVQLLRRHSKQVQ
jgi:L-ascorbate metabolism protein UlaG (beta-lactamase superfamily)